MALAVVTGVTGAEDLAALAQLCHGFSEATVVRVATADAAHRSGPDSPASRSSTWTRPPSFPAAWGTVRR